MRDIQITWIGEDGTLRNGIMNVRGGKSHAAWCLRLIGEGLDARRLVPAGSARHRSARPRNRISTPQG